MASIDCSCASLRFADETTSAGLLERRSINGKEMTTRSNGSTPRLFAFGRDPLSQRLRETLRIVVTPRRYLAHRCMIALDFKGEHISFVETGRLADALRCPRAVILATSILPLYSERTASKTNRIRMRFLPARPLLLAGSAAGVS